MLSGQTLDTFCNANAPRINEHSPLINQYFDQEYDISALTLLCFMQVFV